MTPEQFQAARRRIGMSTEQLAEVLGVLPRAVEAWEQTPGAAGSRNPNGIACRVLQWIEEGKLKL